MCGAELRVRKCSTQELLDVREIAQMIRRRTRSLDVINAVGALVCYCRCLEHAAKRDHAAASAELDRKGGRSDTTATE